MANDLEFWNDVYSEDGYAFGVAPNEFVVWCAQEIAPGRVLSIGEGDGRNGVWLAEQGFEVHGIELSPIAVEKAHRLAAERGVTADFRVGDLADTQLEADAWDVIVSSYAHLPSALRERVHADVVSALRPGGHLILSACNPRQLGRRTRGPKDPDLLLSLAAARRELGGLEFIFEKELEVAVHVDGVPVDPGVVTLVFARKPDPEVGARSV